MTPETSVSDSDLKRYLPALDGLRGISILWVLSLHLPGQMPPGGNAITNRGHFGVELFFAISGFLVTRSLHQCIARAERDAQGTFAVVRDFVARRVSRIWPPYFLALVVVLVAALLDPTFRGHFAEVTGILWSYPTFLANYAIPYQEPPLSLLVMWSLCFEEQFYVILIAVYLLSGKRLARWLLVAALVSISLRFFVALVRPETFVKFAMQMQLHWRFDAIAWGCLAWLYHRPIRDFWERTRHRRLFEVVIVLAAIAACVPDPTAPLGQAAAHVGMAVAFTLLVVALAFSPDFWLARALSIRPLAFIGVISYELYLSHVSVYRALSRLKLDDERWLYYPLCLSLSLVVAWLFHRLFAKPTQVWVRSRLTPLPVGA